MYTWILFVIMCVFLLLWVFDKKHKIRTDTQLQYKVPQNKPIIISQPKQKQIQNRIPQEKKLLIDNSDLVYYRDRNKQIIQEYEQRRLLYPEQKRQQDSNPNLVQFEYRNPIQIDFNLPDEFIFEQIRQNVDNQTVHDTVVQNSIKTIYADLKNEPDISFSDSSELIAEIKEFANGNNFSKEKEKQVFEVLDQIQNRNASVYNLEDTELGVLKTVWEKGNKNVKDQVLNELLDCKSGPNQIYCPTGVVTRIINASCIENPEEMPRTKDTLRQELLTTAADVRNTLEDSDKLYQNKNEHEQKEYFKEKLLETVENQYKNNTTVNVSIVLDEINEWIDYV
jgi:hypothetical protein